jgi:hypothetical protein
MENVRPEVESFLRSCEHLFGFTHESGMLTPEECQVLQYYVEEQCQVLQYYVEELHQQIAPHCNSKAPCDANLLPLDKD